MHMDNVDFDEACKRLGHNEYVPNKILEPSHNLSANFISSKPPVGTPPPNFSSKRLGDPTMIFEIKDVTGDILGYEVRYEFDGKKEPRIFSWGYDEEAPDSPRWRMRHFNSPRPLYGLQRLKTAHQVLLTEGPKKADAGHQLLPIMANLSWLGGANGWSKMDWSPIRGRSVIIWPDADAPGREAAEKIAAIISDPHGLACQVKIIDTSDMPPKWDVADALAEGWDSAKTLAWAKPRAIQYKPAAEAIQESLAAEISQPPADGSPIVENAPQGQPTRLQRPVLKIVGGTAQAAIAALQPDADGEILPQALSEDHLADFFVKNFGADWRYVAEWGSWFRWDGMRWVDDTEGQSVYIFVQVTRMAILWPEASALTSDGKRKINSRRYAGAARDIAAFHPRITAKSTQWDNDPWLLGIPDGVLDLNLGKPIQNSRDFYITKKTAVNPKAGECPIWLKFLDRITDGNQELIGYLKRYAGYCLTGDTSAQAFSFLYGQGQNGKGVFLSTIKNIMGDYAQSIDDDTLMSTDSARHTQELAVLVGCRLAVVDETDSAKRWNEGRIKRLTGGMPIVAHHMRQDNFEFMPVFKMWIAGNHRPALRSVGKAMARRMHLVPFTVNIPDEERDERLGEKLKAEYPAILAWMIEGCQEWQRMGLAPPGEVTGATKDYLEAEDVLGAWLECDTCNGTADGRVLYDRFKVWADANGHPVWSRRSWANAMLDRGVTSRKSSGIVIYSIGLKNQEVSPPPFTDTDYWSDN